MLNSIFHIYFNFFILLKLSNQITSLYPYYATLPKFARENQIVKTAYKALEFTKPTLSIKEKEMALNFMCTASLELDECNSMITH